VRSDGEQKKLDALHARSLRHVARGLCKSCPREAEPGRKSCSEHLLYYRQFHREQRARRVANGLCLQCESRTVLGGVYCESHRSASNARGVRARAKANRCLLCKQPRVSGRSSCAAHLERTRLRIAALRSKKRLIRQCIDCDAPAEDAWRCAKHAELAARSRRPGQAARYEARKLAGECTGCGKPLQCTQCKKFCGHLKARLTCHRCHKRQSRWQKKWKKKRASSKGSIQTGV